MMRDKYHRERILDAVGFFLALVLLVFIFSSTFTLKPREKQLQNEINRLENNLVDKEWKIKMLEERLESYQR